MKVYRIVPVDFGSSEQAFNGKGAVRYPGRWHRAGHRVVYTAESIALGVLEKLVHVGDAALMLDYVWFAADIPDAMIETPASYPEGWDAPVVTDASMGFGSMWLDEQRSLALVVPSVIVPERNVMINPLHKDFAAIKIEGPFPIKWDGRFGKLFERQ